MFKCNFGGITSVGELRAEYSAVEYLSSFCYLFLYAPWVMYPGVTSYIKHGLDVPLE